MLLIIDFSIIFEYFKGNISRHGLLQYKDMDDQQKIHINSIINNKNGDIDWKSYTKYCRKHNNQYGNKDKKIAFNWTPSWCGAFCRPAIRKYLVNNNMQIINDILPAKFTTMGELKYWINDVLVLDEPQIERLNYFSKLGVCCDTQIIASIISLIHCYSAPLYVLYVPNINVSESIRLMNMLFCI